MLHRNNIATLDFARFGAVVPNASGGRVSSDPTTESSWGKSSTANQRTSSEHDAANNLVAFQSIRRKYPPPSKQMCVDFDLNCLQLDSAEKLGGGRSSSASSQKRPRQQQAAPTTNHSMASGGPRRPAPTRHKQPHGKAETTGGKKGGEPQNKQPKPNPRGSQRKPDHPRDPKREPTKT